MSQSTLQNPESPNNESKIQGMLRDYEWRLTCSTSSRFWLPYIPAPSESTPRFPNRNKQVVLYPFVSGPQPRGAKPSEPSCERKKRRAQPHRRRGRRSNSKWNLVTWGAGKRDYVGRSLTPETLLAEDEDERWDFYWVSFFPLSILAVFFLYGNLFYQRRM